MTEQQIRQLGGSGKDPWNPPTPSKRELIVPSPGELQSEIAERIKREWCETVRKERVKGRQRLPPRGHWLGWSGG